MSLVDVVKHSKALLEKKDPIIFLTFLPDSLESFRKPLVKGHVSCLHPF